METVPHAVDPNRAAQHGSVVMRLLDEIFPLVEGVYVDLHKNPELSHSEQRTANIVAEWLTRTGYEVHKGVGGTGVVGILRNGPGPTVMLRADMDALPLEEKTGLPYASTATAVDADGVEVPVMHACGHDAHTACLVGVADLLSETRQEWAGTIMIVAQPGEETLDGAQGMIDDGLFDRFGRPDVILAQHLGSQPAGLISHRAGIILGAANAYRVRIHGEGGHASQPHTTVDPVLIAANIVSRLQGVVSREISPSEMAVLTVGRIQAGTKANIIPDEAYLEISTRALNENVSDQLEQAIGRIVRAEAAASGAGREPEVERFQGSGVTHNDPASTGDVAAAHLAYFGEEYVIHLPDPSPATEDFCRFGLPDDPQPIPYVFWFVGATPHDVWEAAPGDTPYEKMGNVPSNHSPFFSPAREPTLRAGLAALTVAALSYLGSENKNPSTPGLPPTVVPVGPAYSGPAPTDTADPGAATGSGASLAATDPAEAFGFPEPVTDEPLSVPSGPQDLPSWTRTPPSGPQFVPSGPQEAYTDPVPSSVESTGDPLTGPSATGTSFDDNDAYDSAFLASSWPAPGESLVESTADADMGAVMGEQDREYGDEWPGGKSDESTLSADMAALMHEETAPPPPSGPPSGPAFGGPPPVGGAHDAPPPGPDDDLPDTQYRY
ncbi:amidohydrolase [Nocardiopsis sp. MG754419]|uniref:amidohydrolase n=1 Tax=Nocardiopsis sp. MG754419 TaxID=2259865 RepID=UPI001BA5C885|nr:amidohydrolase [Nocardiopsis sp. MG754419]MBR8743623.1 amidohydrolase [Nocardiopsis sp. MG754419]